MENIRVKLKNQALANNRTMLTIICWTLWLGSISTRGSAPVSIKGWGGSITTYLVLLWTSSGSSTTRSSFCRSTSISTSVGFTTVRTGRSAPVSIHYRRWSIRAEWFWSIRTFWLSSSSAPLALHIGDGKHKEDGNQECLHCNCWIKLI